MTAAGRGPYSEILLADTITNTLEEPASGPFSTQIWFILVMAVVVIVVIAAIAGVALLVGFGVVRHKLGKGTYSCEYNYA